MVASATAKNDYDARRRKTNGRSMTVLALCTLNLLVDNLSGQTHEVLDLTR